MRDEIIMVGAGGHAKVCIELLHAMGKRVAFCVGGAGSPETCRDIPILKGDENLTMLRAEGYSRAFIGIGANHIRVKLAEIVRDLGYTLQNAISPSAVISPSAHIGSGVAIMAGVVINAEAHIGDLSIVNTGATVDHDCRVGRGVHIAPQCALAGNVMVGDYTFLGIGTKVIPEMIVGQDVTIGAGGIVITDIASESTAVGVPAKVIKKNR